MTEINKVIKGLEYSGYLAEMNKAIKDQKVLDI
jgi:hypothetical protein